jgi:hypothetical protein
LYKALIFDTFQRIINQIGASACGIAAGGYHMRRQAEEKEKNNDKDD